MKTAVRVSRGRRVFAKRDIGLPPEWKRLKRRDEE